MTDRGIVAEGVVMGMVWFVLVTGASSFAGVYIADGTFERNLTGFPERVADRCTRFMAASAALSDTARILDFISPNRNRADQERFKAECVAAAKVLSPEYYERLVLGWCIGFLSGMALLLFVCGARRSARTQHDSPN